MILDLDGDGKIYIPPLESYGFYIIDSSTGKNTFTKYKTDYELIIEELNKLEEKWQ